eukprot:3762929-Prymnesium_polylepis.1
MAPRSTSSSSQPVRPTTRCPAQTTSRTTTTKSAPGVCSRGARSARAAPRPSSRRETSPRCLDGEQRAGPPPPANFCRQSGIQSCRVPRTLGPVTMRNATPSPMTIQVRSTKLV